MLLALRRMVAQPFCRLLFSRSQQQAERLQTLVDIPFTPLPPAGHSHQTRVVLLIIWWLLGVVVVEVDMLAVLVLAAS
jgi:hypothetical protein